MIHVGFFRAEKMDPDIEMAEERGNDPGHGREEQGWDPEDQEAEEVHSIIGKPENAFFYQWYGAIGGIKMINAECPQETEMILNRIKQEQDRYGQDHGQGNGHYRRQRERIPVGP